MKWRINPNGRTVGEYWSDVDKTVIYPELVSFGVDVKSIPVKAWSELPESHVYGAAAGTLFKELTPKKLWPRLFPSNDTLILVSSDAVNIAYPTNEDKYVMLVHELAHVRQAIMGALGDVNVGVLFYNVPHERDALRWMAKQGKHMGWSEQRLQRLIRNRYVGHGPRGTRTILQETQLGFKLDPRQDTLTLLQRRPVFVRHHHRRKQRG